MIPGIKYSPEQLLAKVFKARWVLIGGLLAGAVLAFGAARSLPKMYRSVAIILVVPQRVPEGYIKTIVAAKIEDRVKTISQEILGQVWLQGIIEEFNLYPEMRQRGPSGLDDAISRMRLRDVKVQFVKGDMFTVSYSSRDPQLAFKVTERLASDFVKENLRDRGDVAFATLGLLDAELKEKQQLLEGSERKLEEYRRRHSGELPTQVGANQQALQNTQIQVQTITDAMNRDRDRRIVIQRELADLAAEPATVVVERGSTPTPMQPGDSVGPLLVQAQETLRDLLTRYKEGHPDVSAARRRVRELENKYAAELQALAGRPGEPPPVVAVTPAQRAQQNRVRQLRTELDSIERRLAAAQGEEQRLRGIMGELQRRIDAAPTRETELVQLTRDYQTQNNMYVNLLNRIEDARLAAKVENGQIGQQFKVIEPPRVPVVPYFPSVPILSAAGAGAGLMFAALIVAWGVYRDGTLKTEEEVMSCIGLPVIAVIPVMTRAIAPPAGDRLRRLLPWGAAAILLPAIVLLARLWV